MLHYQAVRYGFYAAKWMWVIAGQYKAYQVPGQSDTLSDESDGSSKWRSGPVGSLCEALLTHALLDVADQCLDEYNRLGRTGANRIPFARYFASQGRIRSQPTAAVGFIFLLSYLLDATYRKTQA